MIFFAWAVAAENGCWQFAELRHSQERLALLLAILAILV
jgi:hypothetical protein